MSKYSDKKQKQRVKNNLNTSGYFLKRLKDAGFVAWKIFNCYDATKDIRLWTVMVDPGGASVYITCCVDYNEGGVYFEFYDCGQKIKNSILYKTKSFEVIEKNLLELKISNDPTKNKFYKNDAK